MSRVFISYVREDWAVVDLLKKTLENNGVEVLVDKELLEPGQRWKLALESAIRSGTFFLSVYSKQRQNRDVSYVNEETVVAIEEIRKRPISKPYFIPIKIDDCDVEDRPIGGGESTLDLHICDLANWTTGMNQLLSVLGVESPQTDLGQPLANGVPSFVDFSGGNITFELIEGAPDFFQGARFSIENGWCQRNEDEQIITYMEVSAPLQKLEIFNKMMGLSGMHAVSSDRRLSEDESNQTIFHSARDYVLPAGATVPDFSSGRDMVLPIPLTFRSEFTASCHLNEISVVGSFQGTLQIISPAVQPASRVAGDFEIKLSDWRD